MIVLKSLWAKWDQGITLTIPEIEALIANVDAGIEFCQARGETGGVLYKAILDKNRLQGYLESRRKGD